MHCPVWTEGDLNMYTRTHTEEKPKRGTCGATFVKYSNMAKHTRIHNGEKPYKCEQPYSVTRALPNLDRAVP